MVRSNGVKLLLRSLSPNLLRNKSVYSLSLSRLRFLRNFGGKIVFLIDFLVVLVNFRYMKECCKGDIGHWIQDYAIVLPKLLEIIFTMVCDEIGVKICFFLSCWFDWFGCYCCGSSLFSFEWWIVKIITFLNKIISFRSFFFLNNLF